MTNSANVSLGYLESKVHYNSLKFIHFTEPAENTGLIYWLGGTTVWIAPSAGNLPASALAGCSGSLEIRVQLTQQLN